MIELRMNLLHIIYYNFKLLILNMKLTNNKNVLSIYP